MTSSDVKKVMINMPPRAKAELTNAEVEAFAAQSFIKDALREPTKPKHVLSFFFGLEWKNHVEEMRQGNCLTSMSRLWNDEKNKAYNQLFENFANLIHDSGENKLRGSEWERTVDGKVAQILLCDQFSRRCFRGTSQAFAYDSMAKKLAGELAQAMLSSAEAPPEIPSVGPRIEGLDGEFYPPYLAFVLVALMHSEDLSDHELCQHLFQRTIETAPPHLHVYFEGEQKVALEHKEVLERFGRYPHRNALLERETTPDESKWLVRTTHVPRWARISGILE